MSISDSFGQAVTALSLDLRRELMLAARSPNLLIGCDYDGTLAPIVSDPASAAPLHEAIGALRCLAELHATSCAVISGRALRDLATLSRLPGEVHLVGSHGSEFDAGFIRALDADLTKLKLELQAELDVLAVRHEGVSLEVKPASVAVHVRDADPATARLVLDQVRARSAMREGVRVVEEKAVIELSVISTDKGRALDHLRRRSGATVTVFLGDDTSDEDAFAALSGADVGIKVGEGGSRAGHRVADPYEAAMVLAFLCEERRKWLLGDQATPIERLSMLAGERSVALITPDACVTWMCHPEPDSAAIFAHLLGGVGAGHFSVTPQRRSLPLGQRYVPGTMVVETRWSGLRVTDYLDRDTDQHRTDLVRVVTGDSPAVVEFAPRPEFGQVPVKLIPHTGGLLVAGTSDPISLYAPGVVWEISNDGQHDSARAVVQPTSAEPIVLELRCGADDLDPSAEPEIRRRKRVKERSTAWLASLRLPNVETDLVARSALTLRGLCHAGSGAIMAAATTSLPEEIGGIRNWDYRYCWIRDGALTAQALVALGSITEAESFLRWLHQIVATVPGPERLHPLYTLAGTPLGPEAVIESLPGYAGSRPVRVGNLANQQVQLDVFGPVVELIADLALARGFVTADDWALACDMVDAVGQRWQEPDHGIWEERMRPRHHVYSKVMCWLAVDRAIKLGEVFGKDIKSAWNGLRSEIASDVLDRGWNSARGSYMAAYDGDDLDAATLHIGLTGVIDPADERFQATVLATESELRSGSSVYRYRRDDGLPGDEGGFHLCTAWLVEAYLLIGRRTEAAELFKHLVNAAGPTGLLPEEYDPVAERSLGNHPQAYSHIGLIRCARLLSAGEA